jgi:hypothetical protein
VIEAFQKGSGFFFQEAKVDDHPQSIQGLRFHGDLHFEIVPMEGFTFPSHLLEIMSGGKIGLDGDFVHTGCTRPYGKFSITK